MKGQKFILFSCLLTTLILIQIGCIENKTDDKKPQALIESCQNNSRATLGISKADGQFIAHFTKAPIKIDGCDKDKIWYQVDWYNMNYKWMGAKVDSTDYYGQFKLAWDNEYLYVLVKVLDDHLTPTLKNGIENYWKGDYVEVFIDEDKSGGNHQFNHQAFAYHISTEGHAIDKSISKETLFFDAHVMIERSQEGDVYLWEMALKLFDNHFDENDSTNVPIKIVAKKSIGFSIAYGDNDGRNSRENFMGSKETHGVNNDEGYINADVFGSILFKE